MESLDNKKSVPSFANPNPRWSSFYQCQVKIEIFLSYVETETCKADSFVCQPCWKPWQHRKFTGDFRLRSAGWKMLLRINRRRYNEMLWKSIGGQEIENTVYFFPGMRNSVKSFMREYNNIYVVMKMPQQWDIVFK